MKILIVPDIDGWAVENMADNIIRVLGDKFEFTKMYAEKSCAAKNLPVFDYDKLNEYYQNYDLIYIMLPSYIKKGMDTNKIITTFHGGPGSEGQGDMMQRFGLNKMRISYVSGQVKDRITKYPVIHSNLVLRTYKDTPEKLLEMWHIEKKSVVKMGFSRSHDPQQIYVYITRKGYDLSDLFFTPHGVNLESYPQVDVKDGLVCGYAGWTKHFLGKQVDHRRSDWILRALGQIEFDLEIAGGLAEHVKDDMKVFREMHKSAIINEKVNIKTYSKEEMTKFYEKISCYLVPDKWAGGPMPVLEAGASGVPSICSDAGLCGDIITHLENGYRINNFEEFVEGIRFMRDNPDERKRMGENMRTFVVNNRTWEAVASYWEAFFLGEKC